MKDIIGALLGVQRSLESQLRLVVEQRAELYSQLEIHTATAKDHTRISEYKGFVDATNGAIRIVQRTIDNHISM